MKIKPGSFFIVLLFVILVFCLNFSGWSSYKMFYYKKINEKIIERNNWQFRATEFYTESGIQIDSIREEGDQFDLKIDDSIVKEANSSIFKVYRRNQDEKYILFHKYNYQ